MTRHTIDHLLIGGGIAGATCAAELRASGAEGTIAIVGRELDAPYHRPPVTKTYLQGHDAREATLIHPPQWWIENEVELLSRTSVLSLDPAARVATLSSKEEVQFGQALIATGATVRRLSADGGELEGIHYLRALGNADALRRDLDGAEHVVMIGGSYIGCEVAASLAQLGKRCTILMLESHPLQRGFGGTVGRHVRAVLEDHGVRVIGDDELAAYEGHDGRVRGVRTKRGLTLAADAVVVGAGAQPDVMLARKSGLAIGETGGVRCDSRLRAEVDGVFAAGDMCEYDSVLHGARVRIEHEDVAAEQGRTVARNMLGADEPHTAVPYFFSDLADWLSFEYVGISATWDEELIDGSIGNGPFVVTYRKGGRVVGALAVGDSAALERAREHLAGGQLGSMSLSRP
jgi:3-phenylpropionate/trans-cinnamate dioxygenase ferredoxin reductase subunit